VVTLSSHADDGDTKLCCEGTADDLSSCYHRLSTIEVPPLTVSVQSLTVEVPPLTVRAQPSTVEVPPPTADKALITRGVDRGCH
jgi:hypothetical protein